MTELTMRNIYEYIQEAERNDIGKHFPFPKHQEFCLHIYNGRRQVNISWNGNTVMNLIFDPDCNDVAIYWVHHEIADYEHPDRHSMDDAMSCIKSVISGAMYESMRDAICPFIQKKREADDISTDDISRDLFVRTVETHANVLSGLIDKFNSLRVGYHRYNGTLYSASPQVEDELEKLCDQILDEVEFLQSGKNMEYMSETYPDQMEMMKEIPTLINKEKAEIKKAKEFLAQYGC